MPATPQRLADHVWAEEALKDLMFACKLNRLLKEANVCSKYLHEMSEIEARRYFTMISQLL